MNLSALERLDLNDRLDELMVQATTAKGLDLLDLNDEIDAILVKLGYGAEASPDEGTDDAKENAPSIVKDFLSGKFVTQAQMDFVDTLRQVGEYLNEFLTLDDMKGQANAWATQNEYAL